MARNPAPCPSVPTARYAGVSSWVPRLSAGQLRVSSMSLLTLDARHRGTRQIRRAITMG